jgi:hypothetical protein
MPRSYGDGILIPAPTHGGIGEAMARRIIVAVTTLAALAMAVGAGWKPGWFWN